MKTINIKSTALGLFLGAATVLCVGAAIGNNTPPIWEHKIITHQSGKTFQVGLEQPLDAAAREGWEAVGVGDNATQPYVLMRRIKR
jgi:hypothetical protein